MDPKQRERLILMGGIAVVAVFVVGYLIVNVVGRANELESSIIKQKRALKEVRELATEYVQIKQRSSTLENRLQAGGPPLLSYLEGLCRNVRIDNPQLNPRRTGENEYYQETSVELKVTGLTLEKVENLLKNIETSPRYLRIKSFKVETPYAHKEFLDMTLQVSSYAPKTPSATPAPKKENP